MIFKNNAYWKKSDGDGPFCPKCFDDNEKMIRISIDQPNDLSKCPKCKNSFNWTGEKSGGGAILAEHENLDPYA